MGRWSSVAAAIALAALLSATTAGAVDAGGPSYPPQLISWEARAELFYDRYERELDYEGDGRLPSSTLGLNFYGARLYVPVGAATAHASGGIVEGRNRNCTGVFLGAGASFHALDYAGFRIYGVAAATYVPALAYIQTQGSLRHSYDEGLLEVSAGALAAKTYRIRNRFDLTPHLGLLLSFAGVSGNVVTKSTAEGDDTETTEDYTALADLFVVASLGASFALNDQVSFRAEARGIGEQSVSLAVDYAF